MTAIERAENFELLARRFARTLGIPTYVLMTALLLWLIGAHGGHHTNVSNVPAVLEAELVENQPKAALHALPSLAARPEALISKKIAKSTESQKSLHDVFETQNQTVPEPPPPADHGPIVDFSPPPKLPSYLKDQNLKTSVVIEFSVSAAGHIDVRLLQSSGNEELDALALKAAGNWRIRPAAQAGKPIDAKVHLRINFAVE